MERHQPLDDLAAYRRCLSQFATGVTVVTARTTEGQLVAMTANSFSSVSLDPPLVSWSVKRTSQSFAAFETAPSFAINILASDQIELSRHFGKSGDDKFDGVEWSPGIDGVPLLTGAAAAIECRCAQHHDGGDHLIMLGSVQRFSLCEREVLLFVQGRYGVARDHPARAARIPHLAADQGNAGPINELMPGLLYRAYGALSTDIEKVQRAEGFTHAEGRILGAIATYPGRTLESLLPELYLATSVAEDGVVKLAAEDLVNIDAGDAMALTEEGQRRLKKLIDATIEQEAEKLEGITPQELDTTRRVLRHLIRGAGRSA